MTLSEQDILHCEQCGAQLDSRTSAYGCFNCLLLGDANEIGTSLPENRHFQHYEVSLSSGHGGARELGRGAMGITYYAVDTNLGSPAALKVISARFSGDPKAR